MELVQLTKSEFYNFVNNSNLSSFYQTYEYARFAQELDYDYELVGLKDKLGNIVAASLLIIKFIDKKYRFAYAPRGFIIDYRDNSLVKDFTTSLTKYFKINNIVFLKINPNILISEYNKEENKFIFNNNTRFIENLRKNKYQMLKKNKYFESMLPAYAPLVDLKTFTFSSMPKNARNKISKAYRKGLSIDKVGLEKLDSIYPFIKNKTKKSYDYYRNLFMAFDKSDMIDIFSVNVNFEEFIINTKSKYQKTLELQNILSRVIKYDQSPKMINRKLQIDKELETLKNDIIIATNGLAKNKIQPIAGAITIKFKDKVYIFTSGYNRKYKSLNANYFMYYKLIEYYKYNYNFINIEGITGDLSKNNPYLGLNEFKMVFNPKIFEYIGEFDIIYNQRIYNKIASDGTLSKLFNSIK